MAQKVLDYFKNYTIHIKFQNKCFLENLCKRVRLFVFEIQLNKKLSVLKTS